MASPHRAPFKVVGKRLPRVDARERVTGGAIYPADLELPGMVHAKLLRSPHRARPHPCASTPRAPRR